MRRSVTQAKLATPKAASPMGGGPRVPAWLVAALLVLVTIAIYWPATRCDFVNVDDNLHVTANVQVQKGLTWESIKWGLFNPVNCIWHPLTVWSHMLDCQLYGLNPWGHHLTSVLLHALNTGLVFLFLLRLTGACWRSVLVAVLFGWHPLRVESVAFVAERKDVLSGFFGLLALIAYVRYAQDRMQNAECRMQNAAAANAPHAPRSTLYLLSLLLFALGLLSKPILVTWPCVMLLLDYWPLGRMHNAECRMQKAAAAKSLHAARSPLHAPRSSLLALLVEKVPFFVLAAVMSLVTFVVQKHAGSLEVGQNFTLGARVGNALISYCRYLGKMFWPTNLSVCYPHPGHWPLGKVLLAGGLILAISVWFWIQRRRAPYLLMGWLWFCGTLAPVSQVLQTGAHAMADRYSYIPSLGVLILTVWGACELTRRWRLPVRALSVAAGGAILLCSTVTRHQIGYWRDSETLLRHALAVTENNGLAHRNLAGALYEKGQIEEAISHFREFVRLRPELANSHYNLGVALCRAGQFEEAIPQLQEAIRLEPDEADAHYNLGTACFQRGRTGEAIWQFQETIRLEPGHAQAHNNLGTALGLKGQTDEAIRQFQEALRLKPDYTEARKNLEVLLANKAHAPPPPSLVTPP